MGDIDAFVAAKQREIDGSYERIAESLKQTLWVNAGERIAKIVADANCPRGHTYEYRLSSYAHLSTNHPGFMARVMLDDAPALPPALPPLTAAMVITVATLGSLEWLRHRKAQVAAAETEGDWKSLADEFWDWIAQLFRAWRMRAMGLVEDDVPPT